MTMVTLCRPIRESWPRFSDRFYRWFPCLSDPGRRSSLGLKVALVALHLVYVGVLFLFDRDLVDKTTKEPWYTAIYLLLFVATLVQYFLTAGSSPGYVLDAIRAARSASTSKQPAASKNGGLVITIDGSQRGSNVLGSNTSSWTKLVMDMYPPGSSVRTWTCTYCNVLQPPRAKHCQDCDKCVLQFDHHCVWLGTCIGQGNHSRFWWYICEETALCIWTGVLYITYLTVNMSKTWWIDVVMILLLVILTISLIFLILLLLFHSYLILTNQTTYELVRRRRIPYLREIPERVHPFSKGICRNLYNFCCARSSIYAMEPLPSAQELEAKSRPYTCLDVLSCRCC
ncbi:Palmitoyltransferase, DHHC domain [Dillenia turbinata]|uniref:S-acyltransferase n=1 Tax=Dillenia turbinata TaxID=194707 RepID=A0AAN8V104_9MAGN